MRIFKVSVVAFILQATCLFCYGQSTTISGRVTDERDSGIVAVSIYIKGRYMGTSTFKNGYYELKIPADFKLSTTKADTILYSHAGYYSKTESIEGNTIINTVLRRRPSAKIKASITGTHKYTKEELKKIKAGKEPGIKESEDEDRIFVKVEMDAEFPSGSYAFIKYCERNVKYPDSASISNVNGVVKIGFTIDKEGRAKNVKLIKGVNKFADDAVLNAIVKMPKWKPALQNGRNVEDYKELEVSFNISGIE